MQKKKIVIQYVTCAYRDIITMKDEKKEKKFTENVE